MQEEVENRTVNLAISTTKLTGRTIIAGIRKYLQHREKVKMKKARDPAVHGKQSVKQLLGQNQGATNVEIDKESMRSSKRTTPMPLLIPFPDGNKNRQSKRSMQRRRQAKGQRKKLPLKQQRKQPKAPKRLQRKRWSFAPHTLKRSCLF